MTTDFLTFDKFIYFRILSVKNKDGKLFLKEDFVFPNYESFTESNHYSSKSGRKIRSRLLLDNNLNRRLSFDYENEIDIFLILESFRHDKGQTRLGKIYIFDNKTYKKLHSITVNKIVSGDIELNTLDLSMDRDVINISCKDKGKHSIFHYRLKNKLITTDNNFNNKNNIQYKRRQKIVNEMISSMIYEGQNDPIPRNTIFSNNQENSDINNDEDWEHFSSDDEWLPN